MNRAFWLALIFSFPFLALGQSKTCVKDIKVVSATWEAWSPGNVQSGTGQSGGSIYKITIDIKRSGDITLDSLVTPAGSIPLEVIKGTNRNYQGPFRKKDRVLLIAYQHSSSPDVPVTKKQKNIFAISYKRGGKRYLTPVPEFQKANPQQENQ